MAIYYLSVYPQHNFLITHLNYLRMIPNLLPLFSRLFISVIPYIMSIFRLSRILRIPHASNAACMTGDSWKIFMEKSGSGLEPCIVFPHVQILVFYRSDGQCSHNDWVLSMFYFTQQGNIIWKREKGTGNFFFTQKAPGRVLSIDLYSGFTIQRNELTIGWWFSCGPNRQQILGKRFNREVGQGGQVDDYEQ